MDVKMTFFGRSRSGRWIVCRDSTRGLRLETCAFRGKECGVQGVRVRDGSELRED